MKDLRELSSDELTSRLTETISRMSKPERIAALLTAEDPKMNEILLRGYNRADFMTALEILEKLHADSPEDEGCRAAIEFIRKNFSVPRRNAREPQETA